MIQQSSVYQETINQKAQIQKDFLAIKPVNTSFLFPLVCSKTLALPHTQFLLSETVVRCRRFVAFHFIILTTASFFSSLETKRLEWVAPRGGEWARHAHGSAQSLGPCWSCVVAHHADLTHLWPLEAVDWLKTVFKGPNKLRAGPCLTVWPYDLQCERTKQVGWKTCAKTEMGNMQKEQINKVTSWKFWIFFPSQEGKLIYYYFS